MTITNKDSILKKYYEANGQTSMFGYDNLEFKTINHPTPHRFTDLCPEFKLKQFNNLDYPAKPRWALDEEANFLKGAGVKL